MGLNSSTPAGRECCPGPRRGGTPSSVSTGRDYHDCRSHPFLSTLSRGGTAAFVRGGPSTATSVPVSVPVPKAPSRFGLRRGRCGRGLNGCAALLGGMTAGAPRILSAAARYAADCRAESAQLGAAGCRPEARMAAPSVPNAGEPLFVIGDNRGSLFFQGSMTGKLDGRVLLDLLPAQAVVFVDRRAARAAVRAVERSGVEGSARLAEAAGSLAKLPGTSTAVVLADALAAKFWCPAGSTAARRRLAARLRSEGTWFRRRAGGLPAPIPACLRP